MTEECKANCAQHENTLYRIVQLEIKDKHHDECNLELKRSISGIEKNQALIQQQLKNMMWPILIILGAVLATLGKNLLALLLTGAPE